MAHHGHANLQRRPTRPLDWRRDGNGGVVLHIFFLSSGGSEPAFKVFEGCSVEKYPLCILPFVLHLDANDVLHSMLMLAPPITSQLSFDR